MKSSIKYSKFTISICIAIIFFSLAVNVSGQQVDPKDPFRKFLDDYKIKSSLGLQFWATYSFDQDQFENGTYSPVDNRTNFQLRRTRLSFSGQPYEPIQFKLTASLDLVGRDVNSATQGGANNGGSPIFRVWNAWLKWKLKQSSDAFHLTMGYMVPQIGRESMNAALKSTSFEKSWSQNYLRRLLVGIGPGRAMGVNLGGQFGLDNESVTMSYNLGVFTPEAFGQGGNSLGGVDAAMLWVARWSINFGDPESEKYSIGHKVNYFSKRNGITLSGVAAYQGSNDLWDENLAYGVDVLWNYNNLNVDGEFTIFNRSSIEIEAVEAHSGYIRFGYNLNQKNGRVIEPVVMFTWFSGEKDLNGVQRAEALSFFSGNDQIIELGFNYHINPKLKWSLFYTKNNGDLGEAEPGSRINNYFNQPTVGAIRRGDLIGLALVIIM